MAVLQSKSSCDMEAGIVAVKDETTSSLKETTNSVVDWSPDEEHAAKRR